MKKLFVIFSLVFCVSGWAQSSNFSDFFDPILTDSNDKFDRDLVEAKTIAQSWLKAYYSKYSDFFSRNSQSKAEVLGMIEALSTFDLSKINRKKAPAVTHCDSNGGLLAFVSSLANPFRVFFRLCDKSFSYDKMQLAQLLTHESYHASERVIKKNYEEGTSTVLVQNDTVEKEVKAVRYELAVLNQIAGGCKYYDIGYMRREPYASAIDNVGVGDIPFCSGYNH